MNTQGADVWMCRIVRDYADMLLRLAYSRLQSEADAEDCVQEVYLKLLRHRPAFRDAEHEKAWLIRTTLNQAADKSPEEILQAVNSAVESFVGDAEQFDDLTMMCIEYRGKDR